MSDQMQLDEIPRYIDGRGEMYADLMNENVRIRAENVMLRKVVFALIAQADKDPFMSIGHFAEHGPASVALAEIRKFNDEQERHMVQQIDAVTEGAA